MADDPDPAQFAYHPPTQEGGESSNLRRTPTHYEIVDTHTKSVVGRAKTGSAASKMVDRRDNAYGAVRYSRRPVYGD